MDTQEISVVGAGLAGLACAWALQARGWKVHVYEARESVAMETSFANAGMLTPSMADPWNSPGIWKHLFGVLTAREPAIQLRLAALPHYIAWGLRFLKYSAPEPHQQATQANFALARFSQQQFASVREQCAIDYDFRSKGTMQVYRDPVDFAHARQHAQVLAEHGMQADVLDVEGIQRVEPLLEPVASNYLGALYYPEDETGDAHRFCQGMAHYLESQGVEFHFGVRVDAIRQERGRVVGFMSNAGFVPTRQLVLASAAHTPSLLAACGLSAHIRPVKGYSLTIPVTDLQALPSLSIIDHHRHTALTPLDDRLRLAGTAELAAWDASLREQHIKPLWQLLEELLPQQQASFAKDQASTWCGFRPMSADGLPYIGVSPLPGLAVCAGHGHLGWTQSLGSGRLLAEMLSGETPSIDPRPYALNRP